MTETEAERDFNLKQTKPHEVVIRDDQVRIYK